MLKQQIHNWFEQHRQEMIADLIEIVEINSISQKNSSDFIYGDGCAQALDKILNLGENYGLASENANYYGGRVKYGNKGKTIGFWGHLDIVPHGDGWIYPPLKCTNTGKFLIGRGVGDNKGACIQNLYAIRCLKELGVPLNNTVCAYFGCAEETGMDDIGKIVDYFSAPDISIVTDAGFPICNGEKGIFTANIRFAPLSDNITDFCGGLVSNSIPDFANITIRKTPELLCNIKNLSDNIQVEDLGDTIKFFACGKASHVASPEGSINAIYVLIHNLIKANILEENDKNNLSLIESICKTYDGVALNINCEDELSGKLTCGGCVVKKDGASVTLSLNIRYPVTTDDDKMIKSITDICIENNFTLENVANSKPYYLPKDSDFVKSMLEIYTDITGNEASTYTMGGGTYARKLPNAVTYGPGLPMDLSELNLPDGHGLCHSPDEAVTIDSFIEAAEIYAMTITKLDESL